MNHHSRVSKHVPKRSRKAGLPPGSLVYLGRKLPQAATPRITVFEYGDGHCQQKVVESIDAIFPLKPAPTITWINVDGIHDEALLAEIGTRFNLEALLLEDILNTDQRPKCEITDNQIYIILKMFDFNPQRQEIWSEQVSLVIGSNFLLTFQEQQGDEFEPVRQRLKSGSKRLHSNGPGYLAYSLVDSLVDSYFSVLEKLGQCLEVAEESMLNPTNQPIDLLKDVHHLRRELIFLRRNVWPVREVISSLMHVENDLLPSPVQNNLRDVYDHTIQAIDTLETYRDLMASVQDLHLSLLSNRMNEIMKVLTVMASIFIPLTFIVGVYGMNFRYMPELGEPYGYPIVWAVMLGIAAAMMYYFRKKHWL